MTTVQAIWPHNNNNYNNKDRRTVTPGTVKVMREAFSDRMILWNGWLPGQVPNDPVIAEDLQENTIELEGNELRIVELGHSDTQDSTCLYVPSMGLAVGSLH